MTRRDIGMLAVGFLCGGASTAAAVIALIVFLTSLPSLLEDTSHEHANATVRSLPAVPQTMTEKTSLPPKLWMKARASLTSKEGEPVPAFEGYCPVTLMDQRKCQLGND